MTTGDVCILYAIWFTLAFSLATILYKKNR
jgi:hypothetical protein